MHYILMYRSLTAAQKAVRTLQSAGIFASVTKAPQSANPGGCTYGAKVAERNLENAIFVLKRANLPIIKVLEADAGSMREVQL